MSPSSLTVEIGDAKPGESRIRRSSLHPEYLTERPVEGVNTVHDVLLYNARIHGSKNGFGWRDVIRTHDQVKEIKKMVDGQEEVQKKTWQYWELSDYKYITYIDMRDIVNEAAKGLVELGIQKDDVFNIYSSTRYVFLKNG